MPKKQRTQEETPYEKIVRRLQEAKEEEVRLAEELVRVLKELPEHPIWGRGNWLGLVERWESAETVSGALKLCLAILRDQEPMTIQNLSRQLRHWRRAQGKTNVGWLEVRMVNGNGPYIYYRWRVPGSRKLHTEYYGRADSLLSELIDLPLVEERGDNV
jgi:hypothetical protein